MNPELKLQKLQSLANDKTFVIDENSKLDDLIKRVTNLSIEKQQVDFVEWNCVSKKIKRKEKAR